MEVSKIVVDKIPEKGCYVCRFNSTLSYCSPDDPMEFHYICTIKGEQIMKKEKYYRPEWCPLVVENECVWKVIRKYTNQSWNDVVELLGVVGCRGFLPPSEFSMEEYIFCPNCGRRIKYESEVKE